MDIKIYLTNLAKYNAGTLLGKWVNLPIEENVLSKELKEVLGNDEEYFITDYEAPFNIDEYDSLQQLNEFTQKLEDMDDYDQHKLLYLINHSGHERKEALESYEDVEFYQGQSLEDLAGDFVDEGLYGDVPDKIKPYIDYEKLGKDLGFDGYNETSEGVFYSR